MTQKHDDAVLRRIREDPELQDTVFEAEAPRPAPQRYVIVHSNRGIIRPARLAGLAIERRKTYWVHSVGMSKRQAEAVAERVLAKLVNWTPDVAGWDSRPMTHEASQPVQKEDTGKAPIYFGVDQFDFDTMPSEELQAAANGTATTPTTNP